MKRFGTAGVSWYDASILYSDQSGKDVGQKRGYALGPDKVFTNRVYTLIGLSMSLIDNVQ